MGWNQPCGGAGCSIKGQGWGQEREQGQGQPGTGPGLAAAEPSSSSLRSEPGFSLIQAKISMDFCP